ncbi:MAG: hypothetical protein Q9208_003144 [Pyrenodesmia sp. 3 TL-2023]
MMEPCITKGIKPKSSTVAHTATTELNEDTADNDWGTETNAAAPADTNGGSFANWDQDDGSDSGYNEDVPPIQLTLTMLEHHKKVFSKKGRKTDRTRLDECSSWVWILKYVGIIANDITPKPLTGDIETFVTLNELFYDNKLVYGPGTSLADRPVARPLKEYVNMNYKVKAEDDSEVSWPVMLQIDGFRDTEENGTSSRAQLAQRYRRRAGNH